MEAKIVGSLKKNKKLIIILAIVLVLIIILIFCFVIRKDGGDSSVKSSTGLVSCTATASDQPQEYPGWKTRLYAAPLQSTSTYADVPDNGTRTFSIKELKAKTSANSLYFRYEKELSETIGGTKEIVEICNSQNKTKQYETTTTTTTSPASDEASAVVTYLHDGIYYINQPGDYRADAYIYVDGAWHFTDRLTDITLTE